MWIDQSRSGEREGGPGGALLIVEAVWTQAGVAVLLTIQPGSTGGSILALVMNTTPQLDIAMVSSPEQLPWLRVRTVAGVGRPAILAPTTVLTRLALTLIDVHLTLNTCKGGTHVTTIYGCIQDNCCRKLTLRSCYVWIFKKSAFLLFYKWSNVYENK